MRNLKSFRFFWHPRHPWGRLSSGDIWVLRFVLKILLQWRHLADIFIFIKMISHVSFIILVPKIVILSLFIPRKLTITKIHHLIRLRFERSEHKKSQCGQKSMWQLCAAMISWLELQIIILFTWICLHFSFLIKCYYIHDS